MKKLEMEGSMFFAKFTAQLQTRDEEINLLGLPALGCGHVFQTIRVDD